MKKTNESTKADKRKIEFSKVMAVIAVVMWVIVNIFGMVVFTMDTSPLAYVIPSVDAVVGAVLAFYMWKARAENQIKLKKIYNVEFQDEDSNCI